MMEENCKSLALKYDQFINNTLKFLDTSIERDYILKLKIIDELTYKINEGETDKITIKKALNEIQEECSKLSYKLKTSARLLDEIKVEKETLLVENKTLKSQLEQLHSVIRTPDNVEILQTHDSNINQLGEKETLNNTDMILSDLNYSYSDDSSYENATKNIKPQSTLIKKTSTNNVFSNTNKKSYEIKNLNINDGQIIATTTLTMNLGCINAKSIIKTHHKASPISSLNNSVDSLTSDTTNEELKIEGLKNIVETNTEKEHNFVQKIIVIPEICEQCHLKINFNSYMIKCLDCKTVAHLECKEHIPVTCTLDQNKINALKCGIPPFIVHCISEIERRGMATIGLYRISGSDKEVKNLKEKMHNGVPNLDNIDIHVLCSCLKDFIRTQKYNLIPQYNLSKMTDALKKDTNISTSFRQSIIELPSANRNILAFLILHLQKVSNSPKCKMNYNCLAIVFGPTIFDLSSTCLDDLQIKSEIIFKVVIELLKFPTSFWNNILKIDSIASDELLHSTPVTQKQSRTPESAHRFFTSGLKRRILDSPQKNKAAKQLELEKKNENNK